MSFTAQPQASQCERLSDVAPFQFVQDWYDTATADHFWMKLRFKFLQDAFKACAMPTKAKLKVLDIGSGNGVIRAQIEGSTAWTVDCADVDESAVRRIRPGRGRNLIYDILDEKPDQLNSYDVILMLDVLEHIEQPEPFLRSAIKHLRPGGWLVINVPALNQLYSRYDEAAGHFRRYTRTSLRGEMATVPMTEWYSAYWGLMLVPLLFVRKLLVSRITDMDEVIRLGFKPSHSVIDRILSLALSLERKVIPWRPCGTSLIFVGQVDKI